jgi:hypothetical protein
MSDIKKNTFDQKPTREPRVKHWVESQTDTESSGGVYQAEAGATGILESIDSKEIVEQQREHAERLED